MNKFTAKQLKLELDRHVIGQDEAKKALSTAAYIHFLKYHYQMSNMSSSDNMFSSHVLLMGPTGCGKTLLINELGHLLQVPVVKIAALDIALPGWSGIDLINHISIQIENSIHKDRRGRAIIFIDEFDKLGQGQLIASQGDHGASIQNYLLKLLEGGVHNTASSTESKGVKSFDTTNVLFIFAGHFEELLKNREQKAPFGFLEKNSKIKKEKKNKFDIELETYGLIPELIGRISIITEVNKLSESELKKIIFDVESSVYNSYKKLYKFLGKDLKLSNVEFKGILKQCEESSLGARKLNSLIQNIALRKLYDLDIDLNNLSSLDLETELELETKIWQDLS